MDLLDCLLEDHVGLRESLAAMRDLVGRACDGDQESLGKLREAQARFLKRLRVHEEVEEVLLAKALRVSGEGERVAVLDADHAGVNDIAAILSALTGICACRDPYAVGFAMARITDELERHMGFEERELFPQVRLKLSVGWLEASGRQAEIMLQGVLQPADESS